MCGKLLSVPSLLSVCSSLFEKKEQKKKKKKKWSLKQRCTIRDYPFQDLIEVDCIYVY